MKRSSGVLVVVLGFSSLVNGSVFGDEKDATPILDAAIKALGGEENLAKLTTVSIKSKGTVSFGGNETSIQVTSTMQGLDKMRSEFEVDFNGQPFKGESVVNGAKGWRAFGDNVADLDAESLASAKQGLYLMAVASTILPLKTKGFKAELAPEGKADGKPADVVKGTGPDGKTFTLYLDKETHLPTMMVATVKGMQGEDFVQETVYSAYKEYNGIKRASKTETKRDGMIFSKQEVIEVKIIDKPAATLFDEPK